MIGGTNRLPLANHRNTLTEHCLIDFTLIESPVNNADVFDQGSKTCTKDDVM